MRYMLLVYLAEDALSETERQACYVDSAALTRDLDRDGVYIDASPLQPIATATSVRLRGGRREVIDGPFAETREQLGGYYVVDVPDLDAALAIAARIPVATVGTIEVRPIMEIPGLPESP